MATEYDKTKVRVTIGLQGLGLTIAPEHLGEEAITTSLDRDTLFEMREGVGGGRTFTKNFSSPGSIEFSLKANTGSFKALNTYFETSKQAPTFVIPFVTIVTPVATEIFSECVLDMSRPMENVMDGEGAYMVKVLFSVYTRKVA